MNNTIGPAVNERELTPREEGVRRFLLESDHVCPFGRDSAEGGTVRMLEVSGLTPQEQTYQALGEFFSNGDQDALVLISAIDPENHNTGRIEASTLNIELAVAMDRIARPGQNLDEITAKWSDARAQLVMGGENNMPLSPLIGRGGHEEKLYAIAMGPQFGKSHPRFSPHLCVVAIRAVALEKAAEAQITAMSGGAKIRALPQARIKATMGESATIHSGNDGRLANMSWGAVLRKLDRIDPGYRD